MTAPAGFAELAVQLHGTVGLYRENGWLARVRVTSVSFDDRGAGLGVEPVPTHGLRSDHGTGWNVYSIWDYLTVLPDRWGQSYPGVSIDFEPELVDAVVTFAATLPPGFTPEHYARLRRFMDDFRTARRPGADAGY